MEKICCIIGHRKFNVSKYREKLTELFEKLIWKRELVLFCLAVEVSLIMSVF